MSATLARAALRTHYVRDPFAIETIDTTQILRELAQASPESDPSHWVGRTPLTEYDHLVLASERRTGECLGVLGACDGVTERAEKFLFLRTAFVAERARGRGLTRRMIALTLLRASGSDDLPMIIATRTSSAQFFSVLRGLATRLAGAAIYPRPEHEPTDLQIAGLARRIAPQIGRGVRFEVGHGILRGGRLEAGAARVPASLPKAGRIEPFGGRTLEPQDQILALIDLRGAAEDVVVEQARRIYRKA